MFHRQEIIIKKISILIIIHFKLKFILNKYLKDGNQKCLIQQLLFTHMSNASPIEYKNMICKIFRRRNKRKFIVAYNSV